jgi:hypothetical protein
MQHSQPVKLMEILLVLSDRSVTSLRVSCTTGAQEYSCRSESADSKIRCQAMADFLQAKASSPHARKPRHARHTSTNTDMLRCARSKTIKVLIALLLHAASHRTRLSIAQQSECLIRIHARLCKGGALQQLLSLVICCDNSSASIELSCYN